MTHASRRLITARVTNASLVFLLACVYLGPADDVQADLEFIRSRTAEEENVIIIGDPNCRTGCTGNAIDPVEFDNSRLASRRSSMDIITSSRGKSLLRFTGEEGLVILNGRSIGDPNGSFTFMSPASGRSVIDLCLCSFPLVSYISDFTVLPLFTGSDHLPIQVSVDCPDLMFSVVHPKSHCKFNYSLSPEYNSILHGRLLSTTQDSDCLSEVLARAISDAARELGMIRVVRQSAHPPWYNSDCRLAKSATRSALRRCQLRLFSPEAFSAYEAAKSNMICTLADAETAYNKSLLVQLRAANSSAEWWATIRKINYAPRTGSTQLTVPAVTSHFHELFNKFPPSVCSILPTPRVPRLDDPITMGELDAVLDSLKRNKAPGPDGLGNEFLMALDGPNRHWLLGLFNRILDSGECPSSWGNVNITLLHKKGDASDPSNHRGIALMNSGTKAFTGVLTRRLATWAEDNGLLPEIQSGFRQERGCVDNLFVLSSIIEDKLRRPGGKLYTLFLDFKQAFDGVDHRLLWQKLSSIGVSCNFVNVIRSLYSSATVNILLPHDQSPPIPVTNGVLQGDTLSPLLFALFLHDIETYLQSHCPQLHGVSITQTCSILGLLYADDYVHLSHSPVHLQLALRTLHSYAIDNGLVINSEKSKVMVFRRSGRLPRGTSFFLGDSEIEVVNKYKYLGVWFTTRGGFGMQAAEVVYRAERAGASVRGLINRIGLFQSDMVSTLASTKIISVLMHGAEIWGLGLHHSLQLPVLRFLKRLLFLHRSTPNHILNTEFGIPPIKAQIEGRALSWLKKVAAMDVSRLPRICVERQVTQLTHFPATDSWLSRILGALGHAVNPQDLSHWHLIDWASLKEAHIVSTRRESSEANGTLSLLSSHCPMYRCLDSRSQFVEGSPLATFRLIMQIRLLNVRFPSLAWDRQRVKFTPDAPCPLCNSGALDSPVHLILDCPVLAGYRPTTLALSARVDGPETARLAAVLNDRSALLGLAVYVATAIRLRLLPDLV